VAIEGLQHEEAGAILGVPLGAVRSRLSQGRQALRQALEAGRTALASPPRLLDNSTGARMRA